METIKGYIEHFIYRNAENGYGVLNFVITESSEEITCVGSFPDVNEGESLEFVGEMVSHPVYGEQLKVTSYRSILPDDAEAMERYLGSGAIKGIGAALAKRIVKKFGEETFRVIEEEPERLAEIRGITERKAADIAVQMAEKRELREAMMFLHSYGISNALAVRVYDRYGNKLQQVLRENPYRLAEDITGVGFKTADEIAERMGIRVDAEIRINCGLLYVMGQAAGEGHTYLPLPILLQRTAGLLQVDEEAALRGVQDLALDRRLILRTEERTDGTSVPQVYTAPIYAEEQYCATKLHEIASSAEGGMERRLERVRETLAQVEARNGVALDDKQREAVEQSLSGGVFLLTGGPGTGKTTTINTILQICEQEQLDVLLAAPTGRAAKRLQEATGYEARTIHRLLEVTGRPAEDDANGVIHRSTARFERNADNPLEGDVVIIDEMSMVDIRLFQALLRAIMPGTHLILVGDSAQLPSVGPGQVLSDLISCGHFPVVTLTHIFRQAEESDIVMNAHHIHRGEPLRLDNHSKDFFFLERDRVEVIYKHLVELIRDKLPGYVHADSAELQVLTPMRRGPLGVETLNHILQEYLNPPAPGKREHQTGERLFREGDRVMQIRNDYQAEWEVVGRGGIAIDHGQGIYNGDMGRILSINETARELKVLFDENRQVRYEFPQLEDLELAYAVTIHKSQGSEYPAVLIPLLSGPRMLMNRNLLYTAVTRARQLVVILGSKSAIEAMVGNTEQLTRYSGLRARIQEVFHDLNPEENRLEGESDLPALPAEVSDL
ncbi:MAG: ATP-dependent RecD-like DNA helicase [Butyrivibrio sp.]|nr:ATP-dependent RecD-like DNA helicase [Butyrivibrio sp.]